MDLNDLKNNPEQIKNLIDILSSLLPDNDSKPKVKKQTPKKTNTSRPSAIKTNKSKAKSDGINIFDSMREKDAHKEDTEIDKKLNRYPPTERARPIEQIAVQCRCCGRKEKINRGLLIEKDRYKCNKCSISAG
jgi:hypothetical protein